MSKWHMVQVPKGTHRRSVSQIGTYERCPRNWHLDKNLKMPRQEKPWTSFGTIFHAIVERYLWAGPEQRVP